MNRAYDAFLAHKAISDPPTGLVDLPDLPGTLFGFQKDIVRWALRRGRAALFAGTGLGKSFMELAWAEAVARERDCNLLLLTPLAVAEQMVEIEAPKFEIKARQVAKQSQVMAGISVTNYQKLDQFDLSRFGAIVLDESSILKSTDGVYRTRLIEAARSIPFRLEATATPAPNDFMELGSHAEFLSVMSYSDMLASFFTHDGGDTQKWRLKGHAEDAFWRWMAGWAVMLRRPSDLGYEDGAFALPPLRQVQHLVEGGAGPSSGMLFALEARTLAERIGARRDSVPERVAKAARITPTDRAFVWWCNLNAEAEGLTRAIPGAVEVRGSDLEEVKARKLRDFAGGRIRVLVTKPSICGFGLNWQHCADTGFVGLNDSFEQVYQAIRRFWRFGQTKPVTAHFIAASTEGAVVVNLKRKEAEAERMAEAMVRHMADLTSAAIRGTARERADYAPAAPVRLPGWMAA